MIKISNAGSVRFFEIKGLISHHWVTHGSALLIFASFITLTMFSRSGYADNVWLFLGLMTLSNLLLFGFFIFAYFQKVDLSARFVFGWALIFHIVGIGGMPLFEDDYYRYMWDAYHTVVSGSPYGVAPSDYFNDRPHPVVDSLDVRFSHILGQINYPDVPTVYGPVFQYSFLLGYLIAPGEVWPLQLIYSTVDLWLIWVLLKMASPLKVMLYAWSPLVFKEVILTAHPDGLAVCLLVVAVFAFQHRYFNFMVIALAMSVAAKVFALIAIPFLMWKSKPTQWLLFFLCLAGLYAPLLVASDSDLLGLTAMAKHWEFNSAIYAVLTLFVNAEITKFIVLASLMLLGAIYWWHLYGGGILSQPKFQNKQRTNTIPRFDWIFCLFLISLPVINPWYWIWTLPFAVLYTNPVVWFASMVLMLSYLTGLNLDQLQELGPYDQPSWVRPVEFGSIVIFSCIYGYWLKNLGVRHGSKL